MVLTGEKVHIWEELSPNHCCNLFMKNKRRYLGAKINHYPNSDSSFQLTRIAISGDVSPNPGPAPKCSSCDKTVRKNQPSVNCTMCYNMSHTKCTKLETDSAWLCSTCNSVNLLSALPFYNEVSTSHHPWDCELSNIVDVTDTNSHLSAITANSNHLSILDLNAQSMCSTFGEFSLLMNDYKFEIATLSETWLKENPLLLQHVCIPGYQLSFRNRDKCKGGGVGVYLKECIPFKRRKDIENLQPDFEHMWLEISGKNKNSKLLLGVVYRSDMIVPERDWIEKFDDLLSNVVPRWEGMLVQCCTQVGGNASPMLYPGGREC